MSYRGVISLAAVAALGIACFATDASAARAARGGAVAARGGVAYRGGAVGARGAAAYRGGAVVRRGAVVGGAAVAGSPYTAAAIATRTISIAVEAPTTLVEFTVAAQSSEAVRLFAAELPQLEVARVLAAAEQIAELPPFMENF